MPKERTNRENDRAKLVAKVRTSFDELFRLHFGMTTPVQFAIYPKLDKMGKYIDVNFNSQDNVLRVDVNPKLADEKPNVIEEQGKRAALKILLMLKNKNFGETDEDYRQLAATFHLWNYGPYAETPQKWHVYKCSKCGRNLAVYAKRLPYGHPLTSMTTPYHKLKTGSREEAHTGTYSYAGVLELKNWELQKLLKIMNRINKEFDGGKRIKVNIVDKRDEMW